MMTIKEITELRKSGEIDKAYNESKKLFESNPEDRFTRIVMSQSIKSLMERASRSGDDATLCELLEEYGSLGLEEIGEAELNNKAAWDVRALLLRWKEDGIYDSERLYRIAEAVETIDFVRPHRYYSILLEAFVRVKDPSGNPWPGLVEFAEWWGLENLLPEDFERVRIHNGQTIPSLAERTYTAYVKCLLEGLSEGSMAAEAEAFIPELDMLTESHPEFQYTLYYKTMLLKSLGRETEAVESARAFVKRKQHEFWSWSMLGDIVDDEELKLSCYCRALLCKVNQAFLVKVHQKAGIMMYRRGDYANARKEFDDVVATCNAKGWHVPDNVAEITRQRWYAETEPEYNNTKYYYAHLSASEDFLCGDVPEKAMLIVKYNQQKQICSFITEDRQRGYFSTKRMRERFADNQIYKARFPEGIDEKLPTKLIGLHRATDVAAYEGILFRRVNAELNIRQGQTFTFIDDIYVDGNLLHNGVRPGDMVDITAVLYYNIKRESWGWRAIRVVPA